MAHPRHRLLPRREWRLLRAEVLRQAKDRCGACGVAEERFMVCHERWEYDDDAGVATLRSLAILCHECNLATHAGMAGRIGRSDQALQRLMAVNGLSREEAEGVLAAAIERWARRSERAWTTAVDQALLERFPALAAVAEAVSRSPNSTDHRNGPPPLGQGSHKAPERKGMRGTAPGGP